MDEGIQSGVAGLVISLAVATLFLSLLGLRNPDFRLALANRWIRWVFISLALAYLSQRWGFSGRPFWMLAAVYFIGWAMVETAYYWWLVRMYSRSQLPPFPTYEAVEGGEVWPANRTALRLREQVERTGFRFLQAAAVEEIPQLPIRASIYESEDHQVRLQAVFLPRPAGASAIHLSLFSKTKEEFLIVTSNASMPFGGVYPGKWRVLRKPLCQSFKKILLLHRERLVREETVPWTGDPVEQLNEAQHGLEKENLEKGILHPRARQEEEGILTETGRYRLWREIWWINYFGKASQ